MVLLKGLAGNLPKFSCLSYAVFQENYYYICVIDLFSCKVIAIQFSKNSTRLVTSTFKQVVIERSYSHSLIFHSDRGFQYLSHTFQQLLHLYKVKSSLHHNFTLITMSGKCWQKVFPNEVIITSGFSTNGASKDCISTPPSRFLSWSKPNEIKRSIGYNSLPSRRMPSFSYTF